jgi:HSP20 family protein
MTKEIQVVEKVAAEAGGEQTRAVPVFAPRVDIYETDEGLTVLAEMPGVDRDGLMIDLKDYTLTLRGAVQPALAEGRSVVYREYEVGDYFRQFTLSEVIDQAKISASLKDGVLTLVLPKVEPAKPRKIEVKIE